MKILVVDDSKAMRMIVMRTLRQAGYEGHTITEASNGAEALDAIKSTTPDVVLSDWNMPEMNGLQLLQELKKQGSAIKFGFVTSEGSAEMRQQATENGALFLVSKPFTVEAFQTALDGVIS
ncbi:MAG: response regulator [Deltaproteobacteria bacterium]|nr:response regulator [Deltaproteobacteria bacterium]